MKNNLKIATLILATVALSACGGNDNKPKAGLITLHDDTSTYDKNFIDGFKAACKKMGFNPVINTNVPESAKCTEAAVNMAEAGCKFVFADSFDHEDYLHKAALSYKDVEFAHATGTKAHTLKTDNFHNAFASIYEGRYLAGVAAGLKLKSMPAGTSHKLGYVGAFTYAEVISGFTSYYLGVKSVVEDVTMDVKFTGSWYDETAERNAAETLIQGGCSIISQHADSWGAPTACETANVPNITYNGSTEERCPNTYVISSKIDWSVYFEYALGQIKENKNPHDTVLADSTAHNSGYSIFLLTPEKHLYSEAVVVVAAMIKGLRCPSIMTSKTGMPNNLAFTLLFKSFSLVSFIISITSIST